MSRRGRVKWRTIKLIQQHRFSPLLENDSGCFLNLMKTAHAYDRSESKRIPITPSFAWALMPQKAASPGPLSGGVKKRNPEFRLWPLTITHPWSG